MIIAIVMMAVMSQAHLLVQMEAFSVPIRVLDQKG